ncbi:MAG TPA: Sec-independent protein translocase protein TatB [Gammaproteobacteria bacterium]|nr:Sec-independent protein translocase protein TatB [Gammaproteobacteria bacterium]
MFDIGFWELSMIMLLALLILGPERLPGMVSTIGNWAGRAKFMARSLRMQVERELAREVAESGKDAPAAKAESAPHARQTPVRQAAEAAQAAEEEALEAARARQQNVQETAESQADDRSRSD